MDVEELIKQSNLVDEHDFGDGPDADDHYSIVLYRHADGRHFIHIRSSGYSSRYSGASGLDQWVDDNDLERWKDLE